MLWVTNHPAEWARLMQRLYDLPLDKQFDLLDDKTQQKIEREFAGIVDDEDKHDLMFAILRHKTDLPGIRSRLTSNWLWFLEQYNLYDSYGPEMQRNWSAGQP